MNHESYQIFIIKIIKKMYDTKLISKLYFNNLFIFIISIITCKYENG